jgi:hypothetical protein
MGKSSKHEPQELRILALCYIIDKSALLFAVKKHHTGKVKSFRRSDQHRFQTKTELPKIGIKSVAVYLIKTLCGKVLARLVPNGSTRAEGSNMTEGSSAKTLI